MSRILMRRWFLLNPKNKLQSKFYSSKTGTVKIENNEKDITIISMDKPPVNSMNLEFLTELTVTLNDVNKQKPRGIVLTSSLPTIFSAGLDIMEMYKPDMTRCSKFWTALQDFWLMLYALETPVVAAINGASPAGGCLAAISCEYRVFVDGKHTMGLNETRLGIIAPKWFQDIYISTIGYRNAEIALLGGTLFTPQEALNIGLVDELANDKADAIDKCKRYIDNMSKIPSGARIGTKLQLRNNTITWLKNNREKDTEIFLNFVKSPKVQRGLELYLQALKMK